jgi:hypothetical protein
MDAGTQMDAGAHMVDGAQMDDGAQKGILAFHDDRGLFCFQLRFTVMHSLHHNIFLMDSVISSSIFFEAGIRNILQSSHCLVTAPDSAPMEFDLAGTPLGNLFFIHSLHPIFYRVNP